MAKKKVAKKTTNTSNIGPLILIVIAVLLGGMALIKIHKHIVAQYSSVPTAQIADSLQPKQFDFANRKIMLNNHELIFVHGSYTASNKQQTALITNRNINPSNTRAGAIVVDNPGGSGTFYYLVGAMAKDDKETYSQPILLGDRIKIVSVNVDDPQAHDNGIITVKYLDRPANTPMSFEPTQEVIKQYAFEDNGNLIEVLK